MKIVSNTKDYYDHVANILGVDETLRYERLPFVTERMPDGSAFYPDDHDLPITQSVADEYRADAANSRSALERGSPIRWRIRDHRMSVVFLQHPVPRIFLEIL